ncbi:UPF0716 protein FxsA [Amphibacillus marinus]|uniref:UPF0716 protein FxsA n=1 Tax=Amphibacillus marinus TaxID=872970 RepID=A0A1H8T2Z7_9BACI|nr:FxsA family protein [Amphibacillus marinus]SEO85439.1 UPF0716 protein FxsA [Amphibacillus marinus]
MTKWLTFLLFLLPALEIVLFIWLGSHVGALPVLALIIFTSLIGATLAKQQGIGVLANVQASMRQRQLPGEAILDGLSVLLGGLLLLIPGFITDLIGLLLLIPITRRPLKGWIKALFTNTINNGRVIFFKRF